MTFRTISRFLPLLLALIFALALASPLRAQPMTFATGSLIIPMDKDFQDSGMLAAFGLVDKLLRAGVRVNWCIQPRKAVGGTDFTASAKDSKTGPVITNHGYRGGPFAIDAADAAAAMPVVTAWQAARPTVAVHVATTQFAATRRLLLTASPRVAVLADGAQNIVFGYLNAAGIPDENGSAWSSSSVDLLTPAQVAGPTAGIDGALFDAAGVPVFSALLSGNCSVASANIPNVMQELQRGKLKPDFDLLDVPRDRFVIAGDAWTRCRAGEGDPSTVGIFQMRGLWFVAGNLMRDLAALNNMEMLPWDAWGAMIRPDEPLRDDRLALFDRLSAITRAPDATFTELCGLYEGNEDLRAPATVFNKVLNRPEAI